MTIEELNSMDSIVKVGIIDAMNYVGWGSLNQSKTVLTLRFSGHRLQELFNYIDTFTFRVSYKGFTADNGKASHRVQVRLDLKVSRQEQKELKDEIQIARVNGKLKDFSFVMNSDEIKSLLRKPPLGVSELRLLATQQDRGIVRVTWEENGSIPK